MQYSSPQRMSECLDFSHCSVWLLLLDWTEQIRAKSRGSSRGSCGRWPSSGLWGWRGLDGWLSSRWLQSNPIGVKFDTTGVANRIAALGGCILEPCYPGHVRTIFTAYILLNDIASESQVTVAEVGVGQNNGGTRTLHCVVLDHKISEAHHGVSKVKKGRSSRLCS